MKLINHGISIRLRREGSKTAVLQSRSRDSRSHAMGNLSRSLALDPKLTGLNSSFSVERAEYWISKGAAPSDTVRSLIKKQRRWLLPRQHLNPSERVQNRLKELHRFYRDGKLARRLASDTDARQNSCLFVSTCRAVAIVRRRFVLVFSRMREFWSSSFRELIEFPDDMVLTEHSNGRHDHL